MENLTTQAHNFCRAVLQSGDVAIDATAGNGHDTLFLAQQVGASGKVFTFDIQSSALKTTANRIEQAGLNNVITLEADHAEMQKHIPAEHYGEVAVVMFNLGYLPSGDKSLVTQPDSTLAAIEQSLELARAGGLVTVLAYTGHPGGQAETDAVLQLLGNLNVEQFVVSQIVTQKNSIAPPELFIVQKQ